MNSNIRTIKQTFLLSSSTVFMLSIHTASTGPSNNIHLRSSLEFTAYFLNAVAKTPMECNSHDTQVLQKNMKKHKMNGNYKPNHQSIRGRPDQTVHTADPLL